MSATARNRRANSANAPRADQLRELNLPRSVQVELDYAGLPIVVMDDCPAAPLPRCLPGCNTVPDDAIGDHALGHQAAAGKPVEAIIETWRIDDEWWRNPIARRYVEVLLKGGKHVVLYEDLITNDWYVQMP